MKLIDFTCKNCGAPLNADYVVERLSMARCTHCKAVFALELPDDQGLPQPRVRVPRPAKFNVDHAPDALTISWRWKGKGTYFFLVFALFWNVFMVVWHTIAWASDAWFMSAFGSIHTVVGFGLIYKVAADFVNTTTIQVTPEALSVERGPLPWYGDKKLDATAIQQLYGKEHVRHGKNNTTTQYSVEAVMPDNVRAAFIKDLEDAESALYLEQEIEDFLKIRHRPIPGALSA